ATHHLWLEPEGERTVEVAAEAPPLLVAGRIVRDPVVPDGDGWTEAELVTARRLDALDRRPGEVLGSAYSPFTLRADGPPHPPAGGGFEWVPFSPGTSEERDAKSARLLGLLKDAREAARLEETVEDEARAATLLARLGVALELFDRPDAAHEALLA